MSCCGIFSISLEGSEGQCQIPCNLQTYLSDAQWANIAAIKNKAVYEIPDDMTFYCDMWTVKYIYAAQYYAKKVYPDLFKDVDMDSFRSDMMKQLYGKTAE